MKRVAIWILLSPLALAAQSKGAAWTNIGPGPAAVEAFAVDPQGTGTVFMGAIAGGVRKSMDGGATWSTTNSGLTSPIVQALTMDASGPQIVYVGTIGGGLFKTSDGAATWQNVPAVSGAVASIAADPKRTGVVYAGVFNNLSNGSIRKSVDGGITWTTVFPSTASIFNITIDPENSGTIYVPTVGHGAFKSTDGGQHWSALASLTPQAIWTLALNPKDTQVLYAGTDHDGIWKSVDAGNTWQQVGFAGSFPVYAVAVDASAPNIVYAGTNGGGVWTSIDDGVTWKSTRLGDGIVLALAVDTAGAIYAGTSSAGAQVSHDRGTTWTTLKTGIDSVDKFGYGIWIDPRDNQKLFVGDEAMYGLVWSRDGGVSWSAAGQGFTGRGSRSVAFDPTDSRRIYAGGLNGNGFFKSTDGGLTWSPRSFGSSAVYVIAVAVDPSSPNAVYVGTQNEGFFKSTDYGDTWVTGGTGLSGAITYLTVDASKSGRLFASTATAFYLSEDGGQSWNNVLNLPAWTVTIDSRAPSTVYAATRTQGVFRSLDAGRTWHVINSGLTNLSMGRSAPVVVDPRNAQTLYVGGDGGVFKSLDGGDHWFAVNAGLSDLSVWGLAMDSVNPSVLYACGPSGVFKTRTGAEVQSASMAVGAVVNGASNLAGPVAPGEVVVITGSGLGPAELIVGDPAANGLYRSDLSGSSVWFDGTPAPLIYTSDTQVAAQIPDSFSSQGAQLTITYEGRTSASFPVAFTQYAPGVFTLDSTGKGQAVALNQDASVNTASNPAKAGDVISLFVTGAGEPAGSVTVMIGSAAAVVTSMTKLAAGILQFAARIPSGAQTGGAVPVLVQVGNASSQAGVTIAVEATSQTATSTAIGFATAVTADAAGNVYFISSNTVFRVDPKGALTRVAGNQHAGYSGDGGPAFDAQLSTDDEEGGDFTAFGFPSGLAVDANGNVYISDGGNARIRKVSPDGIITTVAGTGVRGYSGDGGPGTSAQISNPRGLAVDPNGDLYIADTINVRKLSAGGIIGTAASISALGVAVDSVGNLYVVDYRGVRKVSQVDGTITTVAGGTGIIGDGGDGGPATSAAFIGPTAVALDRAANLYIGDVSRIREVSSDGFIKTVAGGGKDDPGDGGPATSAQIAVESIAVDATGSLYIAGNGRVRKVSPDGTITTVAGNGK